MAKIIALDTPIFIYLLEEHPKYLPRVRRIFQTLRDGKKEGVFSVIGMVEILTGPKIQDRTDLAAQYERHIRKFPHLSVLNLNERIVWFASDLRAKYGIATPDAIHIATAIDAGANKFITNDKALTKIREIAVELL